MSGAKHSILLTIFFFVVFSWCSCKKDTATQLPESNPALRFDISFRVDTAAVQANKLIYHNKAGNNYSITNYQCYLSNFAMLNEKQQWVGGSDVWFADAFDAKTQRYTSYSIPAGVYSKLRLIIGLDSLHNLNDALPATAANINMKWPPEMGDGYHFLKFEGKYVDDSNNIRGFMMHLGTNMFKVELEIPVAYNTATDTVLSLSMNINEWFCNPFTYSLTRQGASTMTADSLMNYIKNNGSDVLSIKK